MKVLHVSALDSQTGAGHAAARIHLGLLARGVQSRFCAAFPQTGLPNAVIPRRRPITRAVHALESRLDAWRLNRLPRFEYHVVSTGLHGYDIGEVVAAERPDIVQLHWIGGGAFRLSSLAGVDVPIVWRLADTWAFCAVEHLQADDAFYTRAPERSGDRSGLIARVWRNKARTYRDIASLTLVCPSRWLAGAVQRSVLLGDRPVRVVASGCDQDLFHPRDPASCRRVFDLPLDRRLVLVGAASNSASWKGGDLLVEALRKMELPTHEMPAHVVSFGSGDLEVPGWEGRVHNIGVIRDRRLMAALYSASDVFVAPSRMENLANTAIEALSCGTPVVAFDVGGMPELISHEVNGYLASPFDTQGLADGIAWVLANNSDRSLSAGARAAAVERHTVGHEVAGYLDIYRALAA